MNALLSRLSVGGKLSAGFDRQTKQRGNHYRRFNLHPNENANVVAPLRCNIHFFGRRKRRTRDGQIGRSLRHVHGLG